MQCLHAFFESCQRAGVGYVELCETQSLRLLVAYQGDLCTSPGLCGNSSVETISTIDSPLWFSGRSNPGCQGVWSMVIYRVRVRIDYKSRLAFLAPSSRERSSGSISLHCGFWTIVDIDRGWVSDVTHHIDPNLHGLLILTTGKICWLSLDRIEISCKERKKIK